MQETLTEESSLQHMDNIHPSTATNADLYKFINLKYHNDFMSNSPVHLSNMNFI